MVICKYYLRGTCRFGENCKNEHVSPDNAASALRKKQDLDPNLVIKAVSNDMEKAEKGHQWPLSAYGPFQGKPCLPGFDDKSFEEVRLDMYEAQKNGTVEQYKQHLSLLLQEVLLKMQSLQNPSNEVSLLLQELYNNVPETQPPPNVFSNPSPFSNNSSLQSNSIFGNASSNSIFGSGAQATSAPNFTFALPENKSIFGNVGGGQQAPHSGSIFTGSNFAPSSSSTNIFANASQNLFPAQSQSTFQNSAANNIFATQNSNFFGASQNPSMSNSIFSQNATTVVNNPFAQQTFSNPQSPLVNQPPAFAATSTIQSPFGTPTTNPPPYGTPTTNPPPYGTPTINPPPYGPPATNSPPFGVPPTNPSPFAPAISNPAPFGSPITNPSPFGAPTTNQPNFAASTTSSPFANTFAGTTAPAPDNRSIFAQSAQTNSSIFGQQPSSTNTQYFKSDLKLMKQDDATVYSKLEQLTENEIKSYESTSFEFGKIPDKPPTLQMCSG